MGKKKTVWYIFIRAIRAKMKNYLYQLKKVRSKGEKNSVCENVHSKMKRKINMRFKDISRWLNLSDDFVAKWKVLANGMNDWLKNCILNASMDPQNIQNK